MMLCQDSCHGSGASSRENGSSQVEKRVAGFAGSRDRMCWYRALLNCHDFLESGIY